MNDDIEKLKGDKHLPRTVMLKRTLKYLKSEWLSFVLAGLLIGINVVIDIVFPLFMQQLTNNLQSIDISMKIILMIAIGYLILGIFSQVFLYFEAMILQKAGQRVVYKLRMEVFEHIENMSQNQFNEMPVGSLVTRVASYTASLSELFTSILVNLVKNVLTVVGVYIIMFFISWKLSLIMLGFLAVVFAISYIFRRTIHKFFTEERRYISDLNTFLNENLSGMTIIQIFNQERRKKKEFNVRNENLRKSRYKVLVAFGIYRPLVSFIYFLAIATTFTMSLQTIITAGEIVAFYLYLSKFFNPIQSIADQINGIQKAEALLIEALMEVHVHP